MAILIVDDDKAMLTLTATFLSRNGFSLLQAYNGQQALQLLNTFTPDLVILDVMMPGINGIELCKRLRERTETQATPVIIMSALSDPETRRQALEAGADAYLSKWEIQNLAPIVVSLLKPTTNNGSTGNGTTSPSVRRDFVLKGRLSGAAH